MNKKFYLYTNGTSVTAGGGFEEYQYRTDVRDAYFKKQIELPKTQLECSYPFYIAKELNVNLINDAKSGSGVGRMVRTTYNWMHKNKNKLKDTLFLLEFQLGVRIDFYISEYNEYLVLNAYINENDEISWTVVKEWYKQDKNEINSITEKYREKIETYLYNFWNIFHQEKRDRMETELLIGYLESLKLDYIVSIDYNTSSLIDKIVSSKSVKNILDGATILQYANHNKQIIYDEVDANDNHISYTGNQLIGNKIASYIKNLYTL